MSLSSKGRAPASSTDGIGGVRAGWCIDGAWVDGANSTGAVYDNYRGTQIGDLDQASHEQVDAAVSAARRSFERTVLDAQQRYTLLSTTASLVERHRADLARLIT